jgi:hypothetical protein
MSSKSAGSAPVHCHLIESGSYHEILTLAAIASQPGRFDVKVLSQLDTAKDPWALRVRYQATLDHDALARLHRSLGVFLADLRAEGRGAQA